MRPDPNTSVIVDNMLSEWGNVAYAELSVLLVHLRFAAFIHQTNHWTARGDNFFGDHLLYDRLYGDVNAFVDNIAEKAVGMGNENNVNLQLQALQFLKLVQGVNATIIPQRDQPVRTSLNVSSNLIAVIDVLLESMQRAGTLTNGIENLLQGVSDKLEEHVYLLKQRVFA